MRSARRSRSCVTRICSFTCWMRQPRLAAPTHRRDAILHELELDAKPRLIVFNKGDLVAESRTNRAIVASARTGWNRGDPRANREGLAAPADQEKTRALAEP